MVNPTIDILKYLPQTTVNNYVKFEDTEKVTVYLDLLGIIIIIRYKDSLRSSVLFV